MFIGQQEEYSTNKNIYNTIKCGVEMGSRVQLLAARGSMSYDEFIGEMRKRGCSEPTAVKIWNGFYEDYEKFTDNDVYLSNLRKAADVLNVKTGILIPK